MSTSIERPDFDEHGGRVATCTACEMVWCEYREPVELLPGAWTGSGEREHACPTPMPYEVARQMSDLAQAAGGIVVSQRVRASIKLGLSHGTLR